MNLSYIPNKDYKELKETIQFLDYEGDKIESFEELRSYLKRDSIQLISRALGNFSYFVAFIGTLGNLEDYLSSEELSEDLEGGYIAIDMTNLSLSELKKHLIQVNN